MERYKENYLFFSGETKNEITDKSNEVSKQASSFFSIYTEVDKYVKLIHEIPIYESFNDLLGTIRMDLRETAGIWNGTLKQNLIDTTQGFRSFCSTYTSYFPELLGYLDSGAKDIVGAREEILLYLFEMKKSLPRLKESLKKSQDLSDKFQKRVDNHQDTVRGKTIPAINKAYAHSEKEMESIATELEDVEKQIIVTESAFSDAAYGAFGSAVGLAVTGTVVAARKTTRVVGRMATITKAPTMLGRLGAKITSKLTGKIVPGITVVLIGLEITALVTTLAFMIKFNKEIASLRARKLSLQKKSIDLDIDLTHLNDMLIIFTSLLDQGSKVSTALNNLNTAWLTLSSSIDLVDSKLKSASASVEINRYAMGALTDLNKEFQNLEKKFTDYSFVFITPMKILDENELISSKLYYSYNRLREFQFNYKERNLIWTA